MRKPEPIVGEFLFVSGELAMLTPKQNSIRTKALRQMLKITGVQFTEVVGTYQGQEEQAFLIPKQNQRAHWTGIVITVKALAEMFKQESVLLVEGDGRGYLYFIGTKSCSECIGWLTQIKEPAIDDDYFYYPPTQTYHSVR